MTNLVRLFAFVVTFLGLSLSAFAKPVYMTVRRDFSSQEKPVIEINYQVANPIILRVLKPKDMKGFIASQIDLRRAWRQPKWEFNPSHFLARSYNESDFSVDWLRRGAQIDMRKAVPELGGSAYSENAPRMPLGPEKLISLPEAFTLVTEQTLLPEPQDKKQPFDVPGFTSDGDSWYGSNLQTRMVELPKLPPGFYLVQTIQGDAEGQVVVVVNDMMAQLQQSGGANSSQAQVRVISRTGKPVAGASVSLRSLQGSWIQNGKTDANGEWSVKGLKETQLLTVVEAPNAGTAIIDSEFFPTTTVFPDLYLYTDRPMYRQGDEVFFRGILRELSGGTSKLGVVKPGTKVDVRIVKADGEPTDSKTSVIVSAYGSFHGKLSAADVEEGVYRVVANVAGADHIGELRVKQYVKPLFYVKITSAQETLRKGEELKAEIKAERYAGGAPNAATAQVQLYRVRKQAPQWIEDAGLGETGSNVTYGFDGGEKVATDIPILVADQNDIKLDEKGFASISLSVPQDLPGDPGYDYTFQLRVTVTDVDGNIAGSSKNFFDLASEVSVQARFSEFLATPGTKPSLSIRSLTPSGQPFAKAKGTVDFQVTPYGGSPRSVAKKSIETNDQGLLKIEAPVGGNGEMRAVVTLFDQKKRPATTDASMILAGDPPEKGVIRVDELKLMTADPTAAPGDTIRLLALLPEGWGADGTNSGQLFLTVAGRTIHSTRVIPLNGLGTWIEQKVDPSYGSAVSLVVSYGDTRTGWSERRSTFRIMDPSKGLNVTVKPASEMVLPGGGQTVRFKVRGHDGKPRRAELSVAVVDRAVLDLQPELRPGLLDFFYPTDRLNLMSFVSSQFQSYGYAEAIARLFKPNYWFAATKAQAEPLDQKDTAHWVGSVVTDENGEAKVDFVLPGNQTIWKVIAVAADTEGRFGEGNAEFKANLPVNMLLGYPQFLRRGDEAQVRVSLNSNETNKAHEVKYSLLPSTTVKAKEALAVNGPVKPGTGLSKATMISIPVEADPQTATLLSQLEVSGSKLSFKNTLKIQTDLTDEIEGIEPDSKTGEINLALAPGEKLRAATLRVTSGLYASVFPSMRWLIRYPYGCVEQLTSSTVPNLVFSGVFEEAKKNKVVLSKEEEELLKNAREFARAGLTRLKAYRQADGSFAWFTSEQGGDVNMTLLVLTILTSVDDRYLIPLGDWNTSLEWLKRQGLPQTSSQAIALSFIESAFHQTWNSRVNESEAIAKLKLQGESALTSGSVTDRALIARAIKRFEFKDKGLETLYLRLISNLQKTLDGMPRTTPVHTTEWVPAATWTGYPGRMGSAIALASRAIFESQKNPNDMAQHEKWRNRILDHFDGVNFGSTFETSMTLVNTGFLIRHELKARAAQATQSTSTLTLNGKPLAAKKRATLGGLDFDISPSAVGAGGKISVGNLGSGSVVRLVVRRGMPLGQSKEIKRGWDLRRQYFRLAPNGAKTPFDPAKDRVKVGDLVFVQIDFARIQERFNPWASRYYILSEQIPAGFSVVDEDKPYEGAPFSLPVRGAPFRVREIGAEQTRWYFDFTRGWMDRQGTVGLVVRANYAGRFATGVTRINDFYNEEQFSQTPSTYVSVDPLASN